MDKYNLDLYEKIRNLQDTFNQEDYHDYQLLLLLIYEIFVEQKEKDIALSIQEFLFSTIQGIISLGNQSKEEIINTPSQYDKLIQNFNILSIIDFMKLLVYIEYKIDNQYSFFLEDKNLINDIYNLCEKIEANLNIEEQNYQKQENTENSFEIYDDLIKDLFVSNDNSNGNDENKELNQFLYSNENDLQHNEDEDYINPINLKEYLIRNNKIENKCNNCNMTEWQNYPISLILDFKDFNILNQDLNNLQLLCPNCFSLFGHKKI